LPFNATKKLDTSGRDRLQQLWCTINPRWRCQTDLGSNLRRLRPPTRFNQTRDKMARQS